MRLIGDSAPWRSSLLSIYDLVREAIHRTWPECRARIARVAPPPAQSSKSKRTKDKDKGKLENPVTRDLVRRLRLDSTIRGRLHVESQREMIEGNLSLDADPKGYLDIAILFYVKQDEVCLALECKRLNVIWKGKHYPLAREYVDKGMMRFVTGQYSSECCVAGMIGYVMDGDVEAAQISVIDQIKTDSVKLLCDPEEIQILSHPDYFSTMHNRTPVKIELRHQLLSAN